MPKQRVTFEPPNPFDPVMTPKVLVDGERVQATEEGIENLRSALKEDRRNGFSVPAEFIGTSIIDS